MSFRSSLSALLLPAAAALFLFGCLEDDTPERRVFVTSQTYQGNFGGIAAADSICRHLARAADLRGRWRAFLSDEQTDAIDRIRDRGPWHRTDLQAIIFNNKFGFTVGANTAIRNEYNVSLLGARAWTGTRADGRVNGQQHCGNWTDSTAYATTGRPNAVLHNEGARWMFDDQGTRPCTQRAHLYCFEQ